MSGDRTSPRYEMIASTRRRWRREQKLAILAEVDAPGGSVSEVARRHGLHTSLLFRWRRDLAKRTRSAS
ncbi:MAG TPA: transposase, partial [Hyphomicrobiaceae bacterium]|nr:transposase [Hyphomicrobiaceae bacterium]